MHLVLLLVGLFTPLYALRLGWYGWATLLMVGNVVANVYPRMIQRYNRGRITRVCLRGVPPRWRSQPPG